MRRVLFLCVGNSGRSQLAEALFNHLAPPGLRALSAGVRPARGVAPAVLLALAESGIDWRQSRPKALTPALTAGASRIISMGCDVNGACPAGLLPAEEWDLPDPKGMSLEDVRALRDEIERRVRGLIAALLAEQAGAGR